MPKLVNHVPQARLYKSTGLARVRINGHEYYLGRWGSREAKVAYERLLADWLTRDRSPDTRAEAAAVPAPPPLTVAEALIQYREHAARYYGTSRELDNIRLALRPLREKSARVGSP